MHKTIRTILPTALSAGILLLTACSQAPAATPTIDANAILTQAAQTVAVELTKNPPVTPTTAPTNPPLPTETSNNPAPTIAQPAQPPAATNTLAPTTAAATTQPQDGGSFVEDVTIPDGTGAVPGAQFEKTWRIKNTGKSTWTVAYALVPIDGDRMGSPDSIPMPHEVRPGETVDISVKLTAPAKDGSYQTFFRLRNASGQFFRLDGTGDLWLKISVGGSTPTPNLTPTITATPLQSVTPKP